MKYIGNRMVGTRKKLNEEWDGPFEIIEIKPNGVDFVIKDTRTEDEKQTIHGKWLAYYQKWKNTQLKQQINSKYKTAEVKQKTNNSNSSNTNALSA